MTKKVAYVICEVGWEYDDNYYSRSDRNGRPKNVLFDKELAKTTCENKNIEVVAELLNDKYRRLGDYFENGFDDDVAEVLKKMGFTMSSNNRYGSCYIEEQPKTLTREQMKEFVEATDFQTYEVVEVDATVNSLYQ